MEIIVNGETCALPADATAAHLIDVLELRGKRVAMEVNGEIVPRSGSSDHCLREGDRVEIVRAVGGG
ncbi:MAG: sulfur carrier protein ThiS [Gammaproteobacteria bacterium]|nr:sulfur carrier protein ThiS [Gammaproteobacteria bacterium]